MIVPNFYNLLPGAITVIYCIRGLIEIRKDLVNKDSNIEMVAFFGNLVLVLLIDKFIFDSFWIITVLQLMGDWMIGLLNLLVAFITNLELFIIALSSLFSQSVIYEPMDVFTWLSDFITIMLICSVGVVFYCICFLITTSCYVFNKVFIQKNILHNYLIQSEERTKQC